MSTGRYRGFDYKQQRICDVFPGTIKARWWFLYEKGEPTGDHFRTLSELRDYVDEIYVDEIYANNRETADRRATAAYNILGELEEVRKMVLRLSRGELVPEFKDYIEHHFGAIQIGCPEDVVALTSDLES